MPALWLTATLGPHPTKRRFRPGAKAFEQAHNSALAGEHGHLSLHIEPICFHQQSPTPTIFYKAMKHWLGSRIPTFAPANAEQTPRGNPSLVLACGLDYVIFDFYYGCSYGMLSTMISTSLFFSYCFWHGTVAAAPPPAATTSLHFLITPFGCRSWLLRPGSVSRPHHMEKLFKSSLTSRSFLCRPSG